MIIPENPLCLNSQLSHFWRREKKILLDYPCLFKMPNDAYNDAEVTGTANVTVTVFVKRK
ncbi:unnamed protein product [Ceutorhynchus assimilis]|uniref:Uncharacterized protein n=1 Tax=Ceutorhynchus assimilis TaxID=467358 RepID=A0A9N9QBG1_9CUCU|nr:unnamed protein product [Ceutorhynchus assimilis]